MGGEEVLGDHGHLSTQIWGTIRGGAPQSLRISLERSTVVTRGDSDPQCYRREGGCVFQKESSAVLLPQCVGQFCIPGKLSVRSLKLQNRLVLRGKGSRIRARSAVTNLSTALDRGCGEPGDL